jgi:hypothetical protein
MLNGPEKIIRCLCISSILVLNVSSVGFAENNFHAGPLFDEFPLTLDSGHRTEAVGPFFYSQETDSEKTWALPPFFSRDTDPAVESREDDFLYPLLTCEYFGRQYRWQFIQLFAFAGGEEPQGHEKRRVTIFPVYFQQRSPVTNENYTALLPFYGHYQDHLFRDDVFIVLFPLYSETRKKDVVNDNYLYPFFNVRHGDGMRGWQFWPFVGTEHKDVTTVTNGFGDVETVGGHDQFFALWPFYFRQNNGIGTDNPEKFRAVLPLYICSRSPQRDATSVLWPFFDWADDCGQKYREWDMPWPFIVVARGTGKTTTRVFPLFSRAHNDTLESDFYLWPFYKYNRVHADPLDERRTRILFYLFQNVTEKITETGKSKRRVDLWPIFAYHRDFNGNNRLQIFAPLETALPDNRGIERNWAPLWSLWRSENNPQSGAGSQSLLWNFYRRDTTPASKKCSLLFGLFQYQSDGANKEFRLFYIPVFKTHGQAG